MEIEVAIPSVLDQTFTYSHHENLEAGVRVKVPFATQGKLVGVVLKSTEDSPASSRSYKLKPIAEVVDESPIFSRSMLELARWISQYYLHPLGDVLRTMLPAAKTKKSKITFELLNPPKDTESLLGGLNPLQFFQRSLKVTDATLKKKLRATGLSSAECQKELKKWISRGWIRQQTDKDVVAKKVSPSSHHQSTTLDVKNKRSLTSAQTNAIDAICEEGLTVPKPQRPFLLFGVTGSGKTEVFLNVLEKSMRLDSLNQAMVLVPEISLTPQMTKIFQERFPGIVSVVHSAMDDEDRWKELERIRNGHARILIGPRSAVFGPFKKLHVIIVDEEHDGSYKQGNGLLYHARDVAVVRGKLEGATVVLGSATPSMESWFNAETNKYKLLELPERATSRLLPKIDTIQSEQNARKLNLLRSGDLTLVKDDSPFSDQLIESLRENLASGQQSIVLVNRRGYAFYLFNVTQGKAAECPQCSISLTVHGKRQILRCHYCDYQTTMDKVIQQCKDDLWAVVGHGSQRAEDALAKAIPEARIARIDSDTIADPRVLPEIFTRFREGKIDILIGTQILAKGHDFPNVTLIGIIEVDQLLSLPDFRGGERTFQLLVQAAGRAGRGELPGRVMVQSMRTDHPVVIDALNQDYRHFAASELKFREAMGYPPYGRMALIEINGSDLQKVEDWCKGLDQVIDRMLRDDPTLVKRVRILGPSPAPLEIIRGRHRKLLIILSGTAQTTKDVAQQVMTHAKQLPHDIRVKVDIDPQSTL